MKTEPKATHTINAINKDGDSHFQKCCGKADLIVILRALMKDGYTDFEIKTI